MISKIRSILALVILPSLSAMLLLSVMPTYAAVPPEFSEAVLVARESIDIKKDVQIHSGDVIVNGDVTDGLTSAADSKVDGGSQPLDIDKDVTTAAGWDLKADGIRIKGGSVIGGDVHYNDLDNSGTILGSHVTPLALPVFSTLPPFATGTPGTADVDVDRGDTLSLPPGNYRDLDVDRDATVVFDGGSYSFRAISAARGSRLLFADRAQVTATGRLDTGQDCVIGPGTESGIDGSGIDASRIIFYVADSSATAVSFGYGCSISANFYAPEGTIKIAKESTATGAFVALRISVENDSQFQVASFFNEPPVAMDDTFDVLEGGAVTGNLLANDTDPNPADVLTLTIPPPTSPAHASSLVLDPDGSFTYTHDGSETLTDSFTYEVCDDGSPTECDTATASFNILPVNDPPTLDPPADAVILEDTEIHQTLLAGISAGGGETQGLTVTASSSAPAILPDPAVNYDSPDTDGFLVYSPWADQYGVVIVTVTVMDDGGTANGGVDTFQQSFTVTIEPVNDPPLAGDDSAETDTDVPVTIEVLDNDTDIDGNLVPGSVAVVGPPSIGTTAVESSTGDITYTPNDGASGTDSFEYVVCDDGTPLPSQCATAIASVSIIAGGGGNQPPTADGLDVFTEGAASLLIPLSASDPEDDTLLFGIAVPPTKGSLGAITHIVPDGQCSETPTIICTNDGGCPSGETCVLPPVTSALVTYTPTNPAAEEADSFEFSATDPGGAFGTAEIRVNPEGDPTDPPPGTDVVEANPLTAETLLDSPVGLRLTGAAPCDGECDGVGDVELEFSIASGPEFGSLGSLTQGSGVPRRTASVTYTPPSGFTGVDSFVFRVDGDVNFDGDTTDPGETDTATVMIEAVAASQPSDPTATDVNATIEMDNEVPIPLSGSPGEPGGGESGSVISVRHRRVAGPVGGNGSLGESMNEAGPTPITPGAGWSATTNVPPAFFWSGTPPVTSADGPFTFTGGGCVSVTDDFNPGDQFNIYDNGQLIGTTPLVQNGPDVELGPDAAYADPTYSSGTFDLAESPSHSIDIEVVPPNSLAGGRAYIRVDPVGSEFCGAGGACGITFAVATLPEFGSVGIINQLSPSTAELLYTPSQGFTGADFFSYTVTDCYGGTATGLVDILVIDTAPCQSCYTIDMALGGQGSGDVTSHPPGISCGGECSAEFNQGTPVTLQARPTGLSAFTGWSGECSGNGPIVVVDESDDSNNNGAVECTASFE